jgi:S1-C subfamily serine protease
MKIFAKPSYVIATLAGLLIIGAGFGIYKFVRSYEQTQGLVAIQQQNLITAQQEIKNLATSASLSEATAQKEIAQAQTSAKQTSDYTSIQASDIASYITGIAQIYCNGYTGSGSLIKDSRYSPSYSILTNEHVISNPFSNGFCFVTATDSSGKLIGDYIINTIDSRPWNSIADEAIMPIENFTDPNLFSADHWSFSSTAINNSLPVTQLNYNLGTLKNCPSQMPMGSNLIIIGYPADTTLSSNTAVGTANGEAIKTTESFNRTVTNGIISSYDSSSIDDGLPYSNYFISAKIDAGNSGGIALSKYNGDLCLLGIPTWVNIGNYETQGIVQNMGNIMYKP